MGHVPICRSTTGPRRASARTPMRWLEAVREAAAGALGMAATDVVLKRRAKRHGHEQHEKTGVAGEDFVITEGGHRFIVNLQAYLDTGLFLDHRNTRALVQSQARGRCFLNLFCYTASFTVYAAAGGAASSLSLDLSNTYLDWARRNLELNGVDLRAAPAGARRRARLAVPRLAQARRAST